MRVCSPPSGEPRPPQAEVDAVKAALAQELIAADSARIARDGRTGVQLAVGGQVEHTSDWLIAVHAEFRWVRPAADS